jgi:hypothetical protein
MRQNLLEIVENLHTAVSTGPDNTNNDEAVIQALQHAFNQKMKKQVQFNRVEMLARKGKAPESILKHPDHVGAAKENQSSTTSPSAPASQTTVSAPIISASTVKNTAASNTSSPQYHYSTPVEDPAVVLKVVDRTLDVPISITQ